MGPGLSMVTEPLDGGLALNLIWITRDSSFTRCLQSASLNFSGREYMQNKDGVVWRWGGALG